MRLAGLFLFAFLAVLAGGFIFYGSTTGETIDFSSNNSAILDEERVWQEPIRPLPGAVQANPRKAALGRKLFHDPLLSGDGTISCASCHDLTAGGEDGRVVAVGIGGAKGEINTPTVFNSGFNFSQYWDGRVSTLEDQVDGPVEHPKEMASNWPAILSKLNAQASYVAEFGRLYRDGITVGNIKDAIATFERTLITPDSRFDRFLKGDVTAITAEEREGYGHFKSFGCVSCHQGVNVGGNMFQVFGAMISRDNKARPETRSDLGRYNVTGREEDKYVFKVPSLRNVDLTAPYFHDGSAPDLATAVSVMAELQLGQSLTDRQVRSIVAFLRTLTGTVPPAALPDLASTAAP